MIPPFALYNFIITIKEALGAKGIPFIHCRAGVGRTGTISTCLSVARYIDAGKLTKEEDILEVVDATIAMGRICRSALFVQTPGQYQAVLTFAQFYLREHQRLQVVHASDSPRIIDIQDIVHSSQAIVPNLTPLIAKESLGEVPAHVIVRGHLLHNLGEEHVEVVKEFRSSEKGLHDIGMYNTGSTLLRDDDRIKDNDRIKMVQTCKVWREALCAPKGKYRDHVSGHASICRVVDGYEDITKKGDNKVCKIFNVTGMGSAEFVETPCLEGLLLTHANRSNASEHVGITPLGSTELLASFLHMTNGAFLHGEDINVPIIPLAAPGVSMGRFNMPNNVYEDFYQDCFGVDQSKFEGQHQISSQKCLRNAIDVEKKSELVADLYLEMARVEKARKEGREVMLTQGIRVRMEIAMALDHHVRIANLVAREKNEALPFKAFEDDARFAILVEQCRDVVRWDVTANDFASLVPLKGTEKAQIDLGKAQLESYKIEVDTVLKRLNTGNLANNASANIEAYWKSEFPGTAEDKRNDRDAIRGMKSIVQKSKNVYERWGKDRMTEAELTEHKVSMFFHCIGKLKHARSSIEDSTAVSLSNTCKSYEAIAGYAEGGRLAMIRESQECDAGITMKEKKMMTKKLQWGQLAAETLEEEKAMQLIASHLGSQKAHHPALEANLIDEIAVSMSALEAEDSKWTREILDVQATLQSIVARSPDIYHRHWAARLLKNIAVFPTHLGHL